MANPYDQAWDLEDASSIIQQDYFNRYENEWFDRFGQTTNRFFQLDTERIGGDGKTMQFEYAPADTMRNSTAVVGSFAGPDLFEPGTLKVRFNRQTTACDFVRVSGSCETNDIDLINGSYGSIVDFVQRMQDQIEPNYDENMAIHRNLTRGAFIGQVNGTPNLNNGDCITSTAGQVAATSTATNAGGARFKIDNGSISYYRRGRRVDIGSYNTSTGAFVAHASNVRVTDVNFIDNSIGVAFTASGGSTTQDVRISTGNLANVVDNDYIFLSNEANAGLYSLGAYFSAASAGESFICGVDRTTASYRFMLPVTINYTAAATPLTKSIVDTLALSMGYRVEKQLAVSLVAPPDLHQKLRNEYTEAAFLNIPDGDNRLERFGNLGTLGLNYQHPVFGLVKVIADPLATPGTLRAIMPKQWVALQYGPKGLRMMPGQGGGAKAGFYRVTDSTPNGGLSMIWRCDWYALHCDWCYNPGAQGQVTGVTT